MKEEIKASVKKYTTLSIVELRKKVYDIYKEKIIGKCVTNEYLGINICFITDGAKKISYGGTMYSKKACLIEVLPQLIKHAKFNNFGNRKPNDKLTVIGYLNFKVSVFIDGKKENIRLAVQLRNDGKFYYNHEINIIKRTQGLRT